MAQRRPDPDLVTGGYLLVHRGDSPGVEGFLSASECLACHFPGYWALSFVDVDVDERRALLAHWGADPQGLAPLVEAATDAFEAGQMGWPAVFPSPKAARRFARGRGVTHPSLTLIGLGLPRGHVEEFLASDEDDGYLAAVALGNELAAGTDAGWEVLADDGGAFHSWHCHPDLVAEIGRGGITAGPGGLIGDLAAAESVAAVFDADPSTGDVRWLPWLLRTYELSTGRR